MAICITKEQIDVVLRSIEILRSRDIKMNDKDIPKDIYKRVYSSMIIENPTDISEQYALWAASFSVDKLSELLKDKAIDNNISPYSLKEFEFLESLKSLDNLKTYLNIEKDLINIPLLEPNTTQKTVEDKIKSTFNKEFDSFEMTTVEGNEDYKRLGVKPRVAKVTGLKTEKGIDIFMKVTSFANSRNLKSEQRGKDTSTKEIERGNLFDLLIREYLTNYRGVSFTEFRASMINNENVIKLLEKTLIQNEPDPEKTSFRERGIESVDRKQFMKLSNHFFDIVETTILKLKDRYKDHYLVSIPNRIYSLNEKLIGQLDLIAISPEGKVKVVELKTISSYNGGKSTYDIQASMYANILEESGFTVDDNIDVFYIEGNNVQVAYQDFSPYFLSSIRIDSTKRKTLDELRKKIELFKDNYLTLFPGLSQYVLLEEPKAEELPEGGWFQHELTSYKQKKLREEEEKRRNERKKWFQKINPNRERETEQSIKKDINNWLLRVFPELKGRNVISIIQDANRSSNIGGVFFPSGFQFYTSANKGVVYHEGWHRFSQLYLTKAEKERLYDIIKKSNISFTNSSGDIINSSEMSFTDVEEFLAEEFVKYVKSPKKYKFPVNKDEDLSFIQKLFKNILDFLANLFNYERTDNEFKDLFKKLRTGTFNRESFSVENVMFPELYSRIVDITHPIEDETVVLLNSIEFNKIINVMDAIIQKGNFDSGKVSYGSMTYFEFSELVKNIKKVLISKPFTDVTYKGTLLYDKLITNPNKEDASDKEVKDANILLNHIVDNYLKRTKITSLRNFIDKNNSPLKEMLESSYTRIIDPSDRDLSNSGKTSEEFGENDDDEVIPYEDIDSYIFAKYNRSSAVPAWQASTSQVKEFFNRLPTLDREVYEKSGKKVIQPSNNLENATNNSGILLFHRTKAILTDILSFDRMLKELSNEDVIDRFPEAKFVKQGLENILEYKDNLISSIAGRPKPSDLDKDSELGYLYNELSQIKQFLLSFIDNMSMSLYKSKNIRLDGRVQKSEFYKSLRIRQFDNIDNSFRLFLSKLNKGFQESSKNKELENGEKFTPILNLLIKGISEKKSISDILSSIKDDILIIEPGGEYLFNPITFINKWEVNINEDTKSNIQKMFSSIGIDIPESLFKDFKDVRDIQNVYKEFIKFLTNPRSEYRQSVENIFRKLSENKDLRSLIFKHINLENSLLSSIKEGNEEEIKKDKIKLYNTRNDIIAILKPIYSTSPINDFLRYTDSISGLFGTTEANPMFPIFLDLGRVLQKYRNEVSTMTASLFDGTLLYQYQLRSNFGATNAFLNKNVDNISDFADIPFFDHLNLYKNPILWKSRILSAMFDRKTGKRNRNVQIEPQTVDVFSMALSNNVLIEKKHSDMNESEKIISDILTTMQYGYGVMRRNEASDSNPRFYVTDSGEPLVEDAISGDVFSSDIFKKRISDYFDINAVAFLYASEELNSLDSNKRENKDLGVFTSIFINYEKNRNDVKSFSLDELSGKVINKEYGELLHIRVRDFLLQKNVKEKFQQEGVSAIDMMGAELKDEVYKAIRLHLDNQVSSAKKKLRNLPENYPSTLNNILENNISTNKFQPGSFDDSQYMDNLLQNFIMREMFNMFEDEILYFANNAYYTNSVKRRKYIINNGSYLSSDPIFTDINAVLNTSSISNEVQNILGYKPKVDKKENELFKVSIKDPSKFSELQRLNKNGEYIVIHDLIDEGIAIGKYSKSMSKSERADIYNKLLNSNKAFINALSGKELADSNSLISLDLYKQVLELQNKWTDRYEDWYVRQKLILARHMGKKLTLIEERFIDDNFYLSGPPLKTAYTGPYLFDQDNMGHVPDFDKFLQVPMIPEQWLGTVYQPLLIAMYKENIDYYVFDSGEKAFKHPNSIDVFSISENGKVTNRFSQVFNARDHIIKLDRQGFKLQLNTDNRDNKATLPVQSKYTIEKIPELIKNNIINSEHLSEEEKNEMLDNLEKISKSLTNSLSMLYESSSNKILNNLGFSISGTKGGVGVDSSGAIVNKMLLMDYLLDQVKDKSREIKKVIKYSLDLDDISSNLEKIGLDKKTISKLKLNILNSSTIDSSGELKDPVSLFSTIKDRMQDIYNEDKLELDKIEEFINNNPTNTIEEVKTILASSSLNPSIRDIIRGALDNIRVLKVNGKKLFQIPALGTERKLDTALRPSRVIRDKDDKVIGVSPAEAKISFSKNFEPLMELKHPDGKKIRVFRDPSKSLRRLNEALRDQEWSRINKNHITFVGFRIPYQDVNFGNHMIIKEFFPPSMGSVISLPLELYIQMGSDNDADTITFLFKKYNLYGNPIVSDPQLNDKLNEIDIKISTLEEKSKIIDTYDNSSEVDSIIEELKKELLPYYNNIDKLNEEINVASIYFTPNKRTLLYRLLKIDNNGRVINLIQNALDLILESNFNNSAEGIQTNLEDLRKERLNLMYLKNRSEDGIVNNMINTYIDIYSLPGAYQSIFNTDDLDQHNEIVSEINTVVGNKELIDDLKSKVISYYSSEEEMNKELSLIVDKNINQSLLDVSPLLEKGIKVQYSSMKDPSSKTFNLILNNDKFRSLLSKNLSQISANKIEDLSYSTSWIADLSNNANNFFTRPMLGMYVKSSRAFITFVKMNAKMSGIYISAPEYRLFRAMNLVEPNKKFEKSGVSGSELRNYTAKMIIPWNKEYESGEDLPLSLTDIEDNIISKNYSEITTALLDLFKNAELYPNLNISWLNIRVHIMLLSQGMPLDDSYRFLNSPILLKLYEISPLMPRGATIKHVVAKLLSDYYMNDLLNEKDELANSIYNYLRKGSKDIFLQDKRYLPIFNTNTFGEKEINNFLRRFDAILANYSEISNWKMSIVDGSNPLSIYSMNQEYNLFQNEDNEDSKRFGKFLNSLTPEQKREQLKILLYFYIANEQSVELYRRFIGTQNLESSKYTSENSIVLLNYYDKLRDLTNVVKTDKGYNKSFYEDTSAKSMRKVYDGILPVIKFINNSPIIDNSFNSAFEKLKLSLFESSLLRPNDELRVRMEEVFYNDFREWIYQNFFFIRKNGKVNIFKKYFENDFTAGLKGSEVDINEDNEIILSKLESIKWFPNQLQVLKSKYPELFEYYEFLQDIDKVSSTGNKTLLQYDKTNPVYIAISQPQLSIQLNSLSDPSLRLSKENIYRNDIEELLGAKSNSNFLSSLSDSRYKFYTENYEEIINFMQTLHEFSLANNGVNSNKFGEITSLFPSEHNYHYYAEALNNFKKLFSATDGNVKVPTVEAAEFLLSHFIVLFKLNNPQFKFSYDNDFRYKSLTGKRYTDNIDMKNDLGNSIIVNIQSYREHLAQKLGLEYDENLHNDFQISIEDSAIIQDKIIKIEESKYEKTVAELKEKLNKIDPSSSTFIDDLNNFLSEAQKRSNEKDAGINSWDIYHPLEFMLMEKFPRTERLQREFVDPITRDENRNMIANIDYFKEFINPSDTEGDIKCAGD